MSERLYRHNSMRETPTNNDLCSEYANGLTHLASAGSIAFSLLRAYRLIRSRCRLSFSGRGVRMWLMLMTAMAVALATLAFSNGELERGVTKLGIIENGRIYAVVEPDSEIRYFSTDGGFTWIPRPTSQLPGTGSQEIETPRGRYALEGTNVLRVSLDGRREVVYSTEFFRDSSNRWMQAEDTEHLGERQIGSDPLTMVYDPDSGNVIVALGLQGVIVETPDGRWTHANVGPYPSTDYSFESKNRTLLSSLEFWTVVIVLSVSWAGAALALSRSQTIVSWETLPMAIIVGGVLLFMYLIFFSIPGLNLFVPVAVALGIWEMNQRNEWRTAALISISTFSLIISGSLVLMFGGSDADAGSAHARWFFPFSMAAFALSIASMAVSWKLLSYWRETIGTIALAAVMIVVFFFVWLHVAIPDLLVKGAAFALPAILALWLRNHVKEETVRDVVLCPQCEYENQPSATLCSYCEFPLRKEVGQHS